MTTTRDNSIALMNALLLPAIVLAIALAQATSSYASILHLDIAADSDDLLSGFGEASKSGADPAEAPPLVPLPGQSPDPLEDDFAYQLDSGTPGTTGTSSSSSTLGSSGGTAPCLLCQVFSIDVNPIIVRLALSQSLLLPTPPGVGLLRPPQ
jgi:hypothetical protein